MSFDLTAAGVRGHVRLKQKDTNTDSAVRRQRDDVGTASGEAETDGRRDEIIMSENSVTKCGPGSDRTNEVLLVPARRLVSEL